MDGSLSSLDVEVLHSLVIAFLNQFLFICSKPINPMKLEKIEFKLAFESR